MIVPLTWSGSHIKVNIGKSLSDAIAQKRGVPQGDKLSPLLFILYISDLPKIIAKSGCSCILYADDLAIIGNSESEINDALRILRKYCDENKLKVNVGKTKIMKFGGGRAPGNILYDGVPLECVKKFEYLGITLSPKFSPSAHCQTLYKKSVMATMALQRKVDIRKVNFKSALKLYLAVIVPAADYGLKFFNLDEESHYNHFRRVAAFYWKKWCGLPNRTSSDKILNRIFLDDHLDIKVRKFRMRSLIAKYYSNHVHKDICNKPGCFRPVLHDLEEENGFGVWDDACQCRFCGSNIYNRHVDDCRHLHGSTLDRLLQIQNFLPLSSVLIAL